MTKWTKQMDDRLRGLITSGGETFEKIAVIITKEFKIEITANAAIGRSHRIDVPRRKLIRRPRSVSPAAAAKTALVAAGKLPPRKRKVAAHQPIPFFKLQDHHCKYVINDDRPFFFCGKRRREDRSPYCPEHHAIAYTPAPMRRRA